MKQVHNGPVVCFFTRIIKGYGMETQMNNINETLLKEVEGHLYKYGCDQFKLKVFLDDLPNFRKRQNAAIDIIGCILAIVGSKKYVEGGI